MGKTGKWIKSFLGGNKKGKDNHKTEEKEIHRLSSPLPLRNGSTALTATTAPKEKRRWSFRRSSASRDPVPVNPLTSAATKTENEVQKDVMAVAAATAAQPQDHAVAEVQTAAPLILLTESSLTTSSVEDAAAIKIQSVFRSYLARKALSALKGLVKLQALVRGHLVRKQATATLRCMQALLTVQARARAQRMQMSEESQTPISLSKLLHRRSLDDGFRRPYAYDAETGMEKIKIVEVDNGESRGCPKSMNSYSNPQFQRVDKRILTHCSETLHPKLDHQLPISPSPSSITDLSPRACSRYFDEYSFATAHSSPECLSAESKFDTSKVNFIFPQQDYADSMSKDYPFCPNYMANTESSKAKVRSHSAPKQRPDSYERQTSKRRPSIEGRNIPRGVKMQRSSSHVESAKNGYQCPWFIKLDRSTVSLKESECGSTSTVLTNTTYCRSMVASGAHRNRY